MASSSKVIPETSSDTNPAATAAGSFHSNVLITKSLSSAHAAAVADKKNSGEAIAGVKSPGSNDGKRNSVTRKSSPKISSLTIQTQVEGFKLNALYHTPPKEPSPSDNQLTSSQPAMMI